MDKKRGIAGVIVVAEVLIGTMVVAIQETAEDPPPPGVEQLMPRGRIAAVLEPEFVSASKAEIPDDAWVLGVVIEGRAKAYSLNLLNRHEVVNDESGDTAFAAVW